MESKIDEMLDDRGFLIDPAQWTEEVAMETARKEGLDTLKPTHWKIILFLRNYYKLYDFIPTKRRACELAGSWDASCMSCHFGGDPVKALKIAGISEPAEEVKAYYRGVCKCTDPRSTISTSAGRGMPPPGQPYDREEDEEDEDVGGFLYSP